MAVALAALAALAVAMGVGRFAFTPVLPLMQADYGLSVREGAWLATGNYFGYLVGSMGAIWLRAPARRTIGVALVAVAATTLAMAWTDAFAAWMVLRFAAGVASAFALVFVSSWALESLAVAGQGRLSGVVFTGVGAGIAATGLSTLAIAMVGGGAAAAWTSLGVGASLLLVLILRVVSRQAPAAAGRHPPVGRAPPRRLWPLVFSYGAFGFAYIVPATFLPVMARSQLGDSPLLFGLAWPVFGAAAAASTLFAMRFFNRIATRRLWIGGNIIMAVGLLLPWVATGAAPLLGSAVFVGGTFMVVTMAGLQEARRMGGDAARPVIAAMTAAFALGQIAGPFLVALLPAGESAFHAAMAGAALLLLASSVALAIPGRSPVR